jgi:hypothetical protein
MAGVRAWEGVLLQRSSDRTPILPGRHRIPKRLLRAAAVKDPELAVALADRPFDHLKQILQILLPTQTALLGSAMGFY